MAYNFTFHFLSLAYCAPATVAFFLFLKYIEIFPLRIFAPDGLSPWITVSPALPIVPYLMSPLQRKF